MGRKKKIVDLIDIRKEIDRSIKELQSACEHHSKSLRQIPHQSSYQIVWTCDECTLVLGYCSPDEIEDFLS